MYSMSDLVDAIRCGTTFICQCTDSAYSRLHRSAVKPQKRITNLLASRFVSAVGETERSKTEYARPAANVCAEQ